MAIVPSSKEDKEEVYLISFKAWIELNPEQKYLFCEHGQYWGANGRLRLFLKNCKRCKA
jgi:hypothetical protein